MKRKKGHGTPILFGFEDRQIVVELTAELRRFDAVFPLLGHLLRPA